jgi:hypothetical protein
MEEHGIRRRNLLHHTFLKADPKLEGKDKFKIDMIFELQQWLKVNLMRVHYSVADTVFSEVIQKAIMVDYKEVDTSEAKIKWVKQFKEIAREKYKRAQENFDRMNEEREMFLENRKLLEDDLRRINSRESSKSPKKSKCPSCSIMGGRSYKYRNMRKSSRNMRKSRRKSRK